MSESTVSVVHVSDCDEESLISTQQQVREQLSAGHDIVLVCTDDVMRRVERMTLASLAYRNQPGRIAIVTNNSEQFADTIPPTMVERMHVFSTQHDAINWLCPQGVFLKSTELYSWID